jgi:E3 ubiquitin-protein ligase RBBP6
MSYIHFKTVYNNNYDKITFDGVSLTLSQLKKSIFEKNIFKLSKQIDFDLEITNADTNESNLICLVFA